MKQGTDKSGRPGMGGLDREPWVGWKSARRQRQAIPRPHHAKRLILGIYAAGRRPRISLFPDTAHCLRNVTFLMSGPPCLITNH